MNGSITTPAADPMRMIDPPRPPSMMCWALAITVFQVPVTLVSMVSRKDSAVIRFHGAGLQMPALATTTSRRPSSPTAPPTAAFSASRSRMSTTAVMTRRPLAPISFAVSARSAGDAESYGTLGGSCPARSTAMMSAPSAARRNACARPCPRAAPVISATLPESAWPIW
ncbi:Uncharacterised protein [Mycobacterium tuberculosis]|nr:Uncharacterised protein [Mycobacterium tuberculosis]